MPASFPNPPSTNQIYTYNDISWIWTGTVWKSVGTAQGVAGNQGVQGISGSYAAQGIQGTTGIQGPRGVQGTQGTYTVSSTTPLYPLTGAAWLDTTDGTFYIYDGQEWFEPGGSFNGSQGTTGSQGLQGLSGSYAAQGIQGTTGIQGSIALKNEIRSDFASNYSYIGVAVYGSSESSSVWTIRRSLITSGGAIGSTSTAASVKWSDRLTSTYS